MFGRVMNESRDLQEDAIMRRKRVTGKCNDGGF